MKAVVFDLSLARYALAKTFGRLSSNFYHGAPSCLSMREVPAPTPPNASWAKLKTLYSGICGSDIGAIYLKSSPALAPFNSFPCVLGHEILARVEEAPRDAALQPGDRVAVDTTLGCRIRQMPSECPSCVQGSPYACEHVTDGCFAPGMTIGFHKDLPGGWAPQLVAPAAQLFRVPDSVSDEAAAMTEPLAIAVHGILPLLPKKTEKVLVIGGGMIAFAVIWALRALGSEAHITQLTMLPYQLEAGRALGANASMAVRDDASFVEEVTRLTGARTFQPIIGPKVFSGGFDLVVDCIGSSQSVRDALRVTRGRGKMLLLGAAATLSGVDWSFVWSRELSIHGAVGYGPRESWDNRSLHTFELVLERLASENAPDVRPLVTHKFSLEDYRKAIEANVERGRHKSIKTLFQF